MDHPAADTKPSRSPQHSSPTESAAESGKPVEADWVPLLQKAAEGLVWMSESDYPWQPLVWPDRSLASLTEMALLEQTGHDPATPVEQMAVGTFFEPACHVQDWQGEAEQATVKCYQTLVKTLQDHLTDVRVYRVGETEVDIYVLGATPAGTIAGLSTKAIET